LNINTEMMPSRTWGEQQRINFDEFVKTQL
jgi:hypothetical protein